NHNIRQYKIAPRWSMPLDYFRRSDFSRRKTRTKIHGCGRSVGGPRWPDGKTVLSTVVKISALEPKGRITAAFFSITVRPLISLENLWRHNRIARHCDKRKRRYIADHRIRLRLACELLPGFLSSSTFFDRICRAFAALYIALLSAFQYRWSPPYQWRYFRAHVLYAIPELHDRNKCFGALSGFLWNNR